MEMCISFPGRAYHTTTKWVVENSIHPFLIQEAKSLKPDFGGPLCLKTPGGESAPWLAINLCWRPFWAEIYPCQTHTCFRLRLYLEIESLRGKQAEMKLSGWALIQMAGDIIRRGGQDPDTHRGGPCRGMRRRWLSRSQGGTPHHRCGPDGLRISASSVGEKISFCR